MKKKYKLGIGLSIIAITMSTILASNIIPFGNLFADNAVKATSGYKFNAGDMLVLGGKQFTVLNHATKSTLLFSKENVGSATTYDKRNTVIQPWGIAMKASPDAEIVYFGAENLIRSGNIVTNTKNIGNNTEFWTDIAGALPNTMQVLGGDGKTVMKKKSFLNVVGSNFNCVPGTVSKDRDYGTKVGTYVESTATNTTCGVSRSLSQCYADFSNGCKDIATWTNNSVSDIIGVNNCRNALTKAQSGNFGIGIVLEAGGASNLETSHPGHTPINYAGIRCPFSHPDKEWKCNTCFWSQAAFSNGPSIVTLTKAGEDCGMPITADTAYMRPTIPADLSSVLFVSANGTPVGANPQTTAVDLTLLDDSIKFAMSDTEKINALTGDVLSLKYQTATVKANHNIMLMVKDKSGKVIKYTKLEDVSSQASGELSIDTGSDGLNLSNGTYTLQLFVEEDNSSIAGKSNRASAITEITLDLQHDLRNIDFEESGTKVTVDSDYYDEDGAVFTILNTTENGNIGKAYPFIRVGTLDELNDTVKPVLFTETKVSYTKDGIYERKLVEVPDPDKYPDGYDYSECLYVQLATSADGKDGTSTMLPLHSVKIDAKAPYFPSGKDNEAKPITLENIKKTETTKRSFFDAVFGIGPSADLEEDYAGEHVKVIPHAKDYAASMYDDAGKLKQDATEITDGIESYELIATPLDADGEVDADGTVITETIQVDDEKFKDIEPYFELQGKEAFWIQITAVDRAGRKTQIEQKLIMDATVAAKPSISASMIDAENIEDEGTPYEGGEIENADGVKESNWSGYDIRVKLALSEDEAKELKSGVDYYEYTTTSKIDEWVKAGNKEEDLAWTSLGKKQDADGKETKEAQDVFETDDKVESEDEEYHFRAVSRAGIEGNEATFKIKKDKMKPLLDLEAIDVETQSEYQEGAAAKKGIRFTIKPADKLPISGVTYYYRGVPKDWKPATRTAGDLPSDEEIPWIEVEKNKDDLYSILVADEFEGTYYFRAQNGANITTAAVDVKKTLAQVGIEQPKTPIKVITTLDKDGSVYDQKWTKEDLTLTISGGLDGSDVAKYYEYATSRTATDWTKVEAVDGEFKMKIGADKTINETYYFRVIKEGDVDDVPYSTTKTGVKIRHDAVDPLIKSVTLSPQSPAIATSYVTLRVECMEKDALETLHASPIAAYSIDDGATWISAGSKSPNVFTYDIDRNRDDIIVKVKDEAGNITTHGETLVIDNIDKTGPSAPYFTNSDEFKNGIWKKEAQDIGISFVPATTGADEWIQHRIQKMVDGVYEEYDPLTGTTGGDIAWQDTPIGQADVTITLNGEGTYRLIARTIDAMERVSAESTTTEIIRIDMTAPTITEIEEKEDKWATAAAGFLNRLTGNAFFKDHITYTFSGEDNAGGSGLAKYQYQLAAQDAVQPADDKWIDAHKGEVNIEEDFTGKLYARSVDHAGNVSNVVEFDGIQVDATLPSLTVTPSDLSLNWTNTNTLTISASDSGSGIKESKVHYTTTYAGSESFADGTLTLDGTGKAIMSDLPDGEYSITFTVTDNSDHVESLVYPVKIDTGLPEIAILDANTGSIVREKDITIEVRNTIGGQQQLNVTLDGKELRGLTLSNKAPEVLSGDNIKVYTIKVESNGIFEAEVIGNTLHDGAPVQAKESVEITNVYSVIPVLKVEAFIGSDEHADRYTSGDWTTQNIEIVLSNTEGSIKTSDLIFQYQEYDKEGTEVTHGWTNIEDSDTSTASGRFSVYGNGLREYRFRVIMPDPDDPGKAPLLVSDVESITIAQDTKRPAAPVLEITDADDYTQGKWYERAKIMEVAFDADEAGLGQWVEYIDRSDATPKWRRAELNTTSNRYEIRIKGDRQHIIAIRSNDAFDRTSVESIAYVNIDTSAPDFEVDTKYTSSNAILTLITKDRDGRPTIGISGLCDATIQKKENGVLVPDTLQHFYGGKATITKDLYGNGTYEVILKTNSGKTVTKDIEVNGIDLPKPVITINAESIATNGDETPYTSGTWTSDPQVRLNVVVKNPTTAGAVTNEYQEDGDSTWTAFANSGTDQSMIISGAGRHVIHIRSTNASGAVSDVFTFQVWIDDSWDDGFAIQNEADYTDIDTPWYNRTQTIKATFPRQMNGCSEWVEYSEDGVTWTHNSKNTYEVKDTGKHIVYARKNDEMGSGNAEAGKELHVYVDKEIIKDFKVKIDKNSYASFLSTITFGAYHKEVKDAVISGDFGISGADKIYIQIVSDPGEYVNTYAANANEAGWQEYTAPVQLENNFKGFVYAKAKDKAGNTSNIIRTDGIVIDTIAPTIEIDDKGGNWISEKNVYVNVSDFSDVAASIVGNASGIIEITYETNEAEPVEGVAEIEDGSAVISGLHDGTYELRVVGKDKAGNESEETKELKLDRTKPSLSITGYDELSFTTANDLKLIPTVGVSGIQKLSVKAELNDGTSINETDLIGPNYAYQAVKNGTYTFTLTNHAGTTVEEVLEVENITDSLDDIMGLDVKTKNLKGEEIDYLHAEELAGTPADPAWSGHDVVFRAHGAVKFKASLDHGSYTDFNADGTFTVKSEGIHSVRIKNDTDATVRTYLVKIDKYEVKDVKIKDSHKYTAALWYNDKRVIQANFTPDDTSGIEEWLEYYDASQSQWIRGDSVILDHEGTHTVRFRGNDELDRPTGEQSVIVNIDKSAPSDLKIKVEKNSAKDFINHLFPNTFDEIVDVTIHANGDISGNRKIEYQLIDEEAGESFHELIGWKEYTDSFTIDDGFKGKVYARASDNAGNKTLTVVTEEGIIVDTQTPQIMFQNTPMSTWSKENTVKATITPTLSGLQSVWYETIQNGITTKHDIDPTQIDETDSLTLENLPNGKYTIRLYARNKAGKTGTAELKDVMFENRAPLLQIEADLEKKASSVPVIVHVDMSNLYTTLESLTWQTAGTSPQDILTDKRFTINSNGVYKIVATTSSGVMAEKILTVTNITNVSSVIGVDAYTSKDHSISYSGGSTWSDQDITLEVQDISGTASAADLLMEMRIIDVTDGTVITPWTIMDADKGDPAKYKIVASDEGSYAYEFRGAHEGVSGSSTIFQVNIDRSAPKKPIYTEETLKRYDNEKWHSDYTAQPKAQIDATEGCEEWLEYNIDGATDFDGDLLWTPTKDPKQGAINVTDDKDHTVLIRTSDRLGRTSDASELHVKLDSTRPTGFYIKAGENKFQDFLDKLTGGIFYKESKTVEIGGNFKISGIDTIEYQLVKTEADFDKNGTWKKVNIAEGDESGTFQLLPGTKGIIYARGVDKAGNETGIIRSDLITIDNSFPLLIVPDDATDWSDVTTMKIKVKDEESGIRSVKYSSEDPTQSGDVLLSDSVDADGYREGTITNLKDGRYLVEIIVTNGAGMTQTKKPLVMIDTQRPDLKVEGQTSKPQTSTTLDLIPVVGGSGLQEIQQLKKNDDGSYEVIQSILPNADGSKTYPYEFIENGTYYFRVVNGAGIASDIKEIVIGNIKSDKPVIIFRTDNGYDPQTWSGRAVTLEVNTNPNAKLSYRIKGSKDWIDADNIYYQNLPHTKTGIYTYEFKAVYEGVAGSADIETTAEYSVKVDLEAPKRPAVQNIADYDQWFKLDRNDPADPIGKIVTLVRDTSDYANGTKYGDGSKESVYYSTKGNVDAQGDLIWTPVENDQVNITAIGDNLVTFKIIDEVKEHVTYSDPVHVKIYAEDPQITLADTTKPVKTFDLKIAIGGALDADDQVKKLSVERIGGDVTDIQPEQDTRNYSFPISKNGTYIVSVEMEFGGKGEKRITVTNIIEEDPILEVSASHDVSGTNKDYAFGTWSTSVVKLQSDDPNNDPDLKIKVRSKMLNGTWSNWIDYITGDDIDVTTSGTTIYQFMTVLTKGGHDYETILDETYAVKVDLTPPEVVVIDEYDTYKDPDTWTDNAVNLTTTFVPLNDGAKEWVEYSLDQGNTWIKKNSVLITKEGKNEIWFRTVDEAGQITTASDDKDKVYVNIDKTTAGTLSMTIGSDAPLSQHPNNITFEKFYQSSDNVTLELKDSDGNVVNNGTLYYQYADGHNGLKADGWQTYTGAFPLRSDFRGSIYAYAKNASGKATDVIRSNGITVDDQAPIIKQPSTDMDTWSKTSSYPIEITDDLSGIDPDSVIYQVSDLSGTPAGNVEKIALIDGKGNIDLDDGEYYIEIQAKDNAGNTATPVRVKVMIDATQSSFTVTSQLDSGQTFAQITATVDPTPISGIKGIYIRNEGSSWQLMDTTSPATIKVYQNGDYEVKVVNGAGKDSAIQTITVTGITNDLPDFALKTTDGFEFGNFWYQPLTIQVISEHADAIYYSTDGKDGPWKDYTDKIVIEETSAYQFTFKLTKGTDEFISMPYDARVIIRQAQGNGGPIIVNERSVTTFMRDVFTSFQKEAEEWWNTGRRISFPPSTSTAPGLKAGTFVQILEADGDGNGIGYNERNFSLVDETNPEYIFHNEGRYVVYQFYAYYKEGEEDNWSKPAEITKTAYNIDGTAPDSLQLSTKVDGADTILNQMTGGLYFKEPITIVPQGSDSLSGIDHYEFQSIECGGDACDIVSPKGNGWQTAETLRVPQDFEGIVYVRAADAAQPANYLEKAIKLAIKDDTTTYRILEDISDWTNTQHLNIEVSPSTTGLQELNYKVFEAGKEDEVSANPAEPTDMENKRFTIRDIPEGVHHLKVIPVENGGTQIHRGAHALKVDRTKPIVTASFEQHNETPAAQLMNTLTLNSFYRPGLIVKASATDKAGTHEIDPQQLTIEYRSNDADWKEYTTPLTFDKEEVMNVSFRAIDPAGNISEVVTNEGIVIDASGPYYEGAANNATYWLPRTVTVRDELSGVDSVLVNKVAAGTRVLVKTYGLTKIEARDRSGNESSIAFTIKGLDGIKDEDITNDLIEEIEKEFEEQKPGYDKELADDIQKQIDDLKDRNKEPSAPDGDDNDNPDGDDINGNGGNSNNGNDGNTNGGDNGNNGTTGGDGSNMGSNNSGSNGSGSGNGNSVGTGDGNSIFALLMLGVMSLLLAGVVRLKQRLNLIQHR